MPSPHIETAAHVPFDWSLDAVYPPAKTSHLGVGAAQAWQDAIRFGPTISPLGTYELVLADSSIHSQVRRRLVWLVIGHHAPEPQLTAPVGPVDIKPSCSFGTTLLVLDAMTGESLTWGIGTLVP